MQFYTLLQKGAEVSSILASKFNYLGFVGEEFEIEIDVNPMNGVLDGTWTSSNENVAEVTHFSTYYFSANIASKSACSTTLTFTNVNGVSTNCTVTVKGSQTITAGTNINVCVGPGNAAAFLFTAPEEFYYWFGMDP